MTTQAPVQSIQELANAIKECIQRQEYEKAYQQYFSPDIINIENSSEKQPGSEVRGFDAVFRKTQQWRDMMDIHSVEVSEPLCTQKHFVLKLCSDVTIKANGKRVTMDELGVYEIQDGKVIREQFFHPRIEDYSN